MGSNRQPYTIDGFTGYPIRESHRARRMRVQVSVSGDVDVVVPVGYSPQRIAQFLVQKQGWIAQTQGRMAQQRQRRSPEVTQAQPSYIFLRAINQSWQVTYCPTAQETVALYASPGRLQLKGAVQQVALCQRSLQGWVRHVAKQRLVRWLERASREVGLPYTGVTIRRQKTRWGSCSSRKAINLNDKLLFLPPEMTRYVLVHELCHTVHLNHSHDFWALVAQWEPDYKALDQSLRQGWQYVPDWLTAQTGG